MRWKGSCGKCKIRILDLCSTKDSVLILSNNKIQKSRSFITAKKGIVFDDDWYDGILGLTYKPFNKNPIRTDTKSLALEVIFFTNQ